MNFDIVSVLIGMVLGAALLIGWGFAQIRSWLVKILDGGITDLLKEVVERMKSDTTWKFEKAWDVTEWLTLELQANHRGYVFHANLLGLRAPFLRWES